MYDMEKQTKKKRSAERKREIISKGIYENGEIKLSGKRLPKRRMNVIVAFKEDEKDIKQNKEKAVDAFIKKWSGVIKAKDIEFVMEKKLDYLVEKHK